MLLYHIPDTSTTNAKKSQHPLIITMSNQVRTLSPSTGEVIFEHPGHSVDQVRQIATSAKDACHAFRSLTLGERKSIVARFLSILSENKDTLANELTRQMGRPISFTAGEIDTACKRGNYLLSIADKSLETIPGEPEEGFRRFVKKEPIGSVLISTAWNV